MKNKPFNPIRGLCDFDVMDGSVANDPMQSGVTSRDRFKSDGCTTKVSLDKDEYGYEDESTNQKQGSSF